MSLIQKQQYSMLSVEYDTICDRLRQISDMRESERTNKINTEANKMRARLHAIQKQMDQIEHECNVAEAAEAAKIAAQKAAAEQAENERRARLPPDAMIDCEDCKCEFVFSGEDQERYTKHGWNPPFRCPDCRQARKDARERGEPMENPHSVKLAAMSISCKDCKNSFEFSGQDQKRYAKKGYANPIRCEDCRDKKKNAVVAKAILINCKECHKDFTHGVGAQKHYTEMKWNDPINCPDCRKIKHAKNAKNTTRSAKSSA